MLRKWLAKSGTWAPWASRVNTTQNISVRSSISVELPLGTWEADIWNIGDRNVTLSVNGGQPIILHDTINNSLPFHVKLPGQPFVERQDTLTFEFVAGGSPEVLIWAHRIKKFGS